MNIYENCPILEDDNYLLRLFDKRDLDDLLRIYSDRKALPYFNSDNCDGDNFYYAIKEEMAKALDFWKMSYENGWFTRLTIIDKKQDIIIGTIELCLRVSDDEFNNKAILRIDVNSDNEKEDVLFNLLSLITPRINELLGSKGIITKAPIYAIDRIEALRRVGYTKSECFLKGKNDVLYGDYWIID